jgi:hypothetical protein
MARILLVEDNYALSRGVIALLSSARHVAASGKDNDAARALKSPSESVRTIPSIRLPVVVSR